MPRPNKLGVPTKTYNLNLSIDDYDWLCKKASDISTRNNEQVSMADLIRWAIICYRNQF